MTRSCTSLRVMSSSYFSSLIYELLSVGMLSTPLNVPNECFFKPRPV
jgi:hypothetical protein